MPGLPLRRHRYGMLEPGADHPLVETAQIDLALVPALAYDIRCMRMGRGGGYYDRYLAAHPDCHTAAVGYEIQIVDSIMTEETDIKPEVVLYNS